MLHLYFTLCVLEFLKFFYRFRKTYKYSYDWLYYPWMYNVEKLCLSYFNDKKKDFFSRLISSTAIFFMQSKCIMINLREALIFANIKQNTLVYFHLRAQFVVHINAGMRWCSCHVDFQQSV